MTLALSCSASILHDAIILGCTNLGYIANISRLKGVLVENVNDENSIQFTAIFGTFSTTSKDDANIGLRVCQSGCIHR